MRNRPIISALFCWLLVLFFSCVTINIYFPEAAIKEIADEIVGEVRKTEEKKKDEVKKLSVKEENRLKQSKTFSFVPAAYAQDQETSVSNPKIRALKEAIKARFVEFERFYDGGHVGEAIDGFVQVREEGDLSLKDRAQLRSLVKDENEDRKNLYAEVARALEIESSQIPRLQKVFAESWIEKARPGWWIQKEDGEWVKK
ncbi:MAG: YdbL family protein [Candidatus Aminicenantes bacterium]|nr:YdbL family protein [Candidatus Aminicenantes bacterium]